MHFESVGVPMNSLKSVKKRKQEARSGCPGASQDHICAFPGDDHQMRNTRAFRRPRWTADEQTNGSWGCRDQVSWAESYTSKSLSELPPRTMMESAATVLLQQSNTRMVSLLSLHDDYLLTRSERHCKFAANVWIAAPTP